MSNSSAAREKLSLNQRRWLVRQLQTWQETGLISAGQGEAILSRYESAEALEDRRRRWLFLALCGIAVVMCAVGVILLVGYNWDALSRGVKAGIIFTAVGLLFVASAGSYDRGHGIAGQVLALGAALMYGTAIFLLAQVYHIGAHYPAGVLWWAVGATIIGLATNSPLVGALGPILIAVWTGMEQGDFSNPNYLCLLIALPSCAQAYRTGKWPVVLLNILSLAIWAMFLVLGVWGSHQASVCLLLFVFLACWAAGKLHRDPEHAVPRCWTVLGTLGTLGFVLPMTYIDYYSDFVLVWPGIAASILVGVTAVAIIAGALRAGLSESWPMLLVAVLAAARLIPVWPAKASPEVFALFFNAAAVLLAVRLILRGSRRDSGIAFFTGVIYALVWVIVRWTSLIGDMLSSAVLFFAAAAALFATAWYWQRSRKAMRSEGEVIHA